MNGGYLMEIHQFVKDIKDEIGKVIIGNENTVELILNALINEGHILLESVPGTGKTTLAKSIARTIDGDFNRIQFTPDVLPSDVTGIHFFNPKDQQFELRVGPVVTNVLLADEINRATPRTQSSLLEVMEEKQVTIDRETVKIEPPFIVLATQNPIESQQGTFDLPEAQLDRFFMKLEMSYPQAEEERRIMQAHRKETERPTPSPICTKENLKKVSEEVRQVHISEAVEDYILDIVRSTREHPYIEVGASPRGTIALMKSVQAEAAMRNRSYVTPNDVKKMAPLVLSHRMVLTLEGATKHNQQEIMGEVLQQVNVPVEHSIER